MEYTGRITFNPLQDNLATNGQFLIGGGHQARAVDCELKRFHIWDLALTAEQLEAVQGCEVPNPQSFIGGSWPYGLRGSWSFGNEHNSQNFTTVGATYWEKERRFADNMYGDLGSFQAQSAWEERVGEIGVAVDFNFDDQMGYPYWKNLLTAEVIKDYSESDEHHFSSELGGRFVRGGECNFDACPAANPDGCPLKRGVDFNSKEECEAFASWNYCRLAGSTRGRPNMKHLDGCHVGSA